MKPTTIVAALAAIVFMSAPAPGQLINGRLISSVYTWEKFDTVGSSRKIARGFQSAILDIGQGSFSLHTHFQAASELKHQLDELPDYRLYYLYARVKDIAGMADLSLGRMPFFAGVGIGTVDGAQATVRFAENAYKLTLYGGADVPSDMTVKGYGSLKNRFALGGQFVVAAVPDLRASVSYMNRRRERSSYWTIRPDPVMDPLPLLITPEPEREEFAGADLSYTFNEARFYGRFDYDLAMKRTQRTQLGARYTLAPDLIVTGDFIYRMPRIPYNSFFTVFDVSSVTELEGGVDYFVTPVYRAFVRGAYVRYFGDHSFRYTAGIGRENVELTYRGSTGYAGILNTFTLSGVYPLFDNQVVPNAAFSFTRYRLDDNARARSAMAAAVGTTLRFFKAVSLDLQGQWVNNLVMKSDFRFFGKLNIWFSERLNLLD